MGRAIRVFLGLVLAVAGAFVAFYPFVSVWQVADEALGELPEIAGIESSGTSHGLGALYDRDFVLATRSYDRTTPAAVHQALTDSGFEVANIDGSQRYVKDCCGDYDAVWVEVTETEVTDAAQAGMVLASATAADADVQLTVVILVLFGLVLLLLGGRIAVAGFAPPNATSASRDLEPSH